MKWLSKPNKLLVAANNVINELEDGGFPGTIFSGADVEAWVQGKFNIKLVVEPFAEKLLIIGQPNAKLWLSFPADSGIKPHNS
jgi:hypothetical protein